MVKGAIAKSVLENADIKKSEGNIAKIDKNIADSIASRENIQQSINDLKVQKSDFGVFAEFLNRILTKLEIPFHLNLSSDNYYLIHNDGITELTLDNISEGEKNMLSFLYFYYSLFEDKGQTELRPEIKLIILDDPITSLDATNRLYMLTLIKELIRFGSKTNDIQTFYFTHIWEDFCQINYSSDNSQTKNFEVYKENEISRLRYLNRAVSPYKKLFKEVYEFSASPNIAQSDENINHIPNNMRRILEEYLNFNAPITGGNATISKITSIAPILFLKEFDKIEKDDLRNLEEMLSIANIYSHNLSPDPDPEAIKRSAEFLMNRFKEINIKHYNAMKS
ncbi:hypothetical protein FACS1894125_3510 [Actinomycetota bacterium]|nr:hypothetical protein FACS1894125_3510 [Actinomycetota bacterium]